MKLVFVHGIGQRRRDPATLEREWIAALNDGLDRAGASMPVSTTTEFCFYGDALGAFVDRVEAAMTGDLAARGPSEGGAPEALAQTQRAILQAVLTATGVSDGEVRRELDVLVPRDPQNWGWVLAAARALARLPGLDGTIIDAFIKEVSVYLTYPAVQQAVDGIVAAGVGTDAAVVVGHSLGSVVSYNVLRARTATTRKAAFVTLGCPLGIDGVRNRLRKPLTSPPTAGQWFNAFDPTDIVALFPLDNSHFDILPPVENYSGVRNFTPNRHSIAGYLSDPRVATRIAHALSSS